MIFREPTAHLAQRVTMFLRMGLAAVAALPLDQRAVVALGFGSDPSLLLSRPSSRAVPALTSTVDRSHIVLTERVEPVLLAWPTPGNDGFVRSDKAAEWRAFVEGLGIDARIPQIAREIRPRANALPVGWGRLWLDQGRRTRSSYRLGAGGYGPLRRTAFQGQAQLRTPQAHDRSRRANRRADPEGDELRRHCGWPG